ncbi:non-reducing end alpha-L-arabinofuranosidase family hydrolase [Streptomyces sp. SD31]|uniref:non-reducing end alpha-L-arabinofuranosidase family hydrolase n=1 Tax=Streptomyces sp. SD31 TaxID=3452208 RepID=UPI003F8CC650
MPRCPPDAVPARGRGHADSTYAYVDQRGGAHSAGLRCRGRIPGPCRRRQLTGGPGRTAGFGAEPPIVTENKGPGGRLDHWVICDDTDCHLFSSDGNGHEYRSRTTVAEFPNGFRDTTVVLSEPNRFDLFEGSNVYRLGSSGKYLMLVEAPATGSDWRRCFRAWTADSLGGARTPLAETEANPFIRSTNVTFGPGQPAWTTDFSHGEMIRDGVDQTLTINPCRLRFLYQVMDPAADGDYSQLPWKLGLVTQTNSSC